jgi:hypothetical protein
MQPHPVLSQALSSELHRDRVRLSRRPRLRPQGEAGLRFLRPVGHGPRVAAAPACAGCLNG